MQTVNGYESCEADSTVETGGNRIRRNLNIRNVADLTQFAIIEGLVSFSVDFPYLGFLTRRVLSSWHG